MNKKKEKTGGENQEGNFKKKILGEKISGRKFQEGNFREKIAKGIGNVWIWIFLI